MITFACFSPHAPILLSDVGSIQDRVKVKKTIESLQFLGRQLAKTKSDEIVISSPHEDWGFNVPLSFLAPNFKGKTIPYLTGLESPAFHFHQGKKIFVDTKYQIQDTKYKVALVASGDTSHCLKPDGPYGLNPDGPKFDRDLRECLKKKDIERILRLDDLYPEAANCGLRSFAFLLGILEATKTAWQPEILSYEGPFGVGYLVVNFKLI